VAAPAVYGGGSAKVDLKLRDFTITPHAASAAAGKVRVTAVNDGKKAHEVLVVRARRGHALPRRGGRIDEAALESDDLVIGEIADVGPGRSRTKTFTLEKGSYVLFCNLPGHYKAGMKARLTVG
jgi:uncharacterized cupredoxin-like copper-binding protein